jgi:predicted ATPase
MATLSVRNVGPIREADLEVKKHTVFIGPQGSGKSTLAKLIAIGGDNDIVSGTNVNQKIVNKYHIHNYLNKQSKFFYETYTYKIDYTNSNILFSYFEDRENPILGENSRKSFSEFINSLKSDPITWSKISKRGEINLELFIENMAASFLVEEMIMSTTTSYIPAERTLLAILNESIWSLIHSDIDFPKSISSFAKRYSQSRNRFLNFQIPFLSVSHKTNQNIDYVILDNGIEMELSQSASGYQSVIPLLLVVEDQRQYAKWRFIIEEPELNLYPTTQKDLIYNLMGGLDPAVTYQEAEWVITTHSPYVLSSFNTLMLAWKVAQRSEALHAEVEQIIPARCWINPDEFAAYYVDKGTVRSIISETTGLIADNELDDVSEDFADEQDKLLDLSRSIPRV